MKAWHQLSSFVHGKRTAQMRAVTIPWPFFGCVFFCIWRWAQQHERIEKLNMQAVVSASTQGDEFVKEFFINHDKVIH